jgi:hypothetical protein
MNAQAVGLATTAKIVRSPRQTDDHEYALPLLTHIDRILNNAGVECVVEHDDRSSCHHSLETKPLRGTGWYVRGDDRSLEELDRR